MIKPEELKTSAKCNQQIRGIKDSMDLLSGKWKILILANLLLYGTMRFMELKRAVHGIAPKKLSSDLQELELNQLISRTVMDTKPVTVEYALTSHGRTLNKLITEIMDWGVTHRKEITK